MRGTIPTGRFDQRIALARDNGWSSCARCAADRVSLNATAAAATGADAPLPDTVLQSVIGAAVAVAARSTPPVISRNTSALDAMASQRFIGIPSVRLRRSARTIPAVPGDREGNSRNAEAGLTVRSVPLDLCERLQHRPMLVPPTAGPHNHGVCSRAHPLR